MFQLEEVIAGGSGSYWSIFLPSRELAAHSYYTEFSFR